MQKAFAWLTLCRVSLPVAHQWTNRKQISSYFSCSTYSLKVLRCPVRGRGQFQSPLKVFEISLNGKGAAKRVEGVQSSVTLASSCKLRPFCDVASCKMILVDILQSVSCSGSEQIGEQTLSFFLVQPSLKVWRCPARGRGQWTYIYALNVFRFSLHGYESKCKSPIHTLNPQADPYSRSRPKHRWSRPIQMFGSPRADPYPNFDAQAHGWRSSSKEDPKRTDWYLCVKLPYMPDAPSWHFAEFLWIFEESRSFVQSLMKVLGIGVYKFPQYG